MDLNNLEISNLEIISSLFILALTAGVIDTIAGGGGLLIVPGLMMAGLDPISAFATNKLQAIFGTSSAAVWFWRKGRVRIRDQIFPVTIAFGCSFCGAVSLSYLDPSFLAFAAPILLITVAFLAVFKPELGDVPRKARLSFVVGSLTIIPLIGFYDGFFGPGTGAFFAMGGATFLGLAMDEATIRAKFYNFASNLGGLVFFSWAGHTSWFYGAIMAVGAIIGGNFGAQLILTHGAGLIRLVLVFVSLAISVKLLWHNGFLQNLVSFQFI
jgi:uncharacterized membrane protein YfcA